MTMMMLRMTPCKKVFIINREVLNSLIVLEIKRTRLKDDDEV